GTGSSGQISFWDSSSSQTGDSSLAWDNTGKKLSIVGTETAETLDVTGRITSSGLTIASTNPIFNLYDSDGTVNKRAFRWTIAGTSASFTSRDDTGVLMQNILTAIHETGNVGIRNTNPGTYKLNLTGTLLASGAITLSNYTTNGG